MIPLLLSGAVLQVQTEQPKRPPAPEPRYLDAQASAAVKRALRRYASLGGIQVLVQGGGSSARIWVDGLKFAERSGGRSWAHSGGTLQVLDRRGQWFRGKAVRAEVMDYAVWAGYPVDPMMRALLVRRNPVRELFDQGQTARSVGTVAIRGKMARLVEISGPAERFTLLIRADGLLASVASESLESGRSISRSERRFTYERIGAIPASAFQLGRPGQRANPLPRIGG